MMDHGRLHFAAAIVLGLGLSVAGAGCRGCGGSGKTDGNVLFVDSGGNIPGVDSGSGNGVDGNVPGVDSGGGGGGNTITCNTTGGDVWQCGDGIDNDGDMEIDLADGNCVGPCDDDEETFATGIPGDNMDACNQDCFFDGNSGSGNDGCEWHLQCDPANPGGTDCPYDPGFNNCDVVITQECLDNCAATCTPGCDCFGCCEVLTPSGPVTIFLGSGPDCTYETPENCESCTPMEECMCPPPPPPPGGSDAGVGGTDAGVPNGIDSGTPCTTMACSNSQLCTTSADCATGYTCDPCAGECVSPACGAGAACTTPGFYCALQIGGDTGCCVYNIP